MKTLPYIFAILFALVAAIGNGIYAWGVKKVEPSSNPFLFVSWVLLTSTIISFIIAFSFDRNEYYSYFITNKWWIIIAAVGFTITQIGFYLLFQNFGTSQYVLYAVFSILTTSIVVGIFIYHENFNLYHFFAIVTAIATIVLFVLGNKKG
ncbi:MAG: EamA family transporter [Bacteroidales bacterium]